MECRDTRSKRSQTKNIHSFQGQQRILADERTKDTKTSSQNRYKNIDESRNHQPATNGQPAGAKRWLPGQ